MLGQVVKKVQHNLRICSRFLSFQTGSKVDFTPDDYETRQIFYASKDGTRVPMFIVARKGARLDGSNPTLLYGSVDDPWSLRRYAATRHITTCVQGRSIPRH